MLISKNDPQISAACKSGMDVKTARKDLKSGKLPGQLKKVGRRRQIFILRYLINPA